MNVKLRITTLAAAALTVAAAAITGLAVSVAPAGASILGNGCDEYDPARAVYYRCVPDRTTFYTPDGANPSAVPQGTGYAGETRQIAFGDDGGFVNVSDNVLIPPPAPYRLGRDYCSNPWYAYSPFEGAWQYSCYVHDVCYGSQEGRKYCDVRFWRDMIGSCKARYAWYDPRRYDCFYEASAWYMAVRVAGAGHYVPRQSNLEPAGN